MKKLTIVIGVFILTFLTGVFIYFSIPKMKNNVERKEIIKEIPQEIEETMPEIMEESEILEEKLEISEEKLEILEENNDWYDEDAPKFNIELLEPGEGFHGDEIDAKSAENWLGLFKDKNGFFLKNSKIKIRRVHDPIVDGFYEKKAKQKTGKSVSVEGKNQPVYLFKNAKMLKEGEVKTLFGGNPNGDEIEENVDYISLTSGFSREFELGNEKYSINVKKGVNKKGEKIVALILENKTISQVLFSMQSFGEDDFVGTLYWVGDLNLDGKLDIITDLYVHENVEYKGLFLSSEGEKGKLVKKVAVFSTTGC